MNQAEMELFTLRWSRTEPSVIFGALTPVVDAFALIQSLAFWTLSSMPALSLQTETELQPSPVRTIT
jgi:hypothetical protein